MPEEILMPADISLKGMHILSTKQFDVRFLDYLFEEAAYIESRAEIKPIAWGKTLACVFYEPSTRTSSSFLAAMNKLGGGIIPITQGVEFSSVAKGESLEDTIRTLSQYADAIVLRHPETGAASRAAKVSSVPIINAGDGQGEHPTQALLDLYAIKQEKGRLDNLNVALVGDLLYGRTIHSLARLLALYPSNKLHFVSPPHLRMPEHLLEELVDAKVTFSQGQDLEATLPCADVVYMTRVQKERFAPSNEWMDAQLRAPYTLTPDVLSMMKPDAKILHPLPRLTEIPVAVDADPRAAYFRQVRHGLTVRMAVLAGVLGFLLTHGQADGVGGRGEEEIPGFPQHPDRFLESAVLLVSFGTLLRRES